PRVCGERRYRAPVALADLGSSPRVRGEVLYLVLHFLSLRFIPACAGRGECLKRPGPATAVHPRVCGERSSGSRRNWRSIGSSPRVRGEAGSVGLPPDPIRFIPACAGRGDGGGGGGGDGTVHPRVCGERCESVGPNTAPNGSSPRVRGEVLVALDSGGSCRFIPACAGRGRFYLIPQSRPSVHPRVCGERSSRRIITG